MCGKIYFEGRPEMLLNIIPSVILPYHLCVKNNFDYMNMAATVNIITFHAHTNLS